jgi:hypothetical protein
MSTNSHPCTIKVGDHVKYSGICVPVVEVYQDAGNRYFLVVELPTGKTVRGILCSGAERCVPRER